MKALKKTLESDNSPLDIREGSYKDQDSFHGISAINHTVWGGLRVEEQQAVFVKKYVAN